MPWAKIDDDMCMHPKIISAGNEAVGAWVRMIAWSAHELTDGQIPAAVAVMFCQNEKILATLLEQNLLESEGDSYQIHDYLRYNPTSGRVRKTRKVRALAGKIGADKTNGKRVGKLPANVSAESRPVPVPVPVPLHDLQPTSTVSTVTIAPVVGQYEESIDRVLNFYWGRLPRMGGHLRPTVQKRKKHQDWSRIRSALELGKTVDELCEAIDGNLKDKWHVDNRHHELEYIFRNMTKIDGFIQTYRLGNPKGASVLTTRREQLEDARTNTHDAWVKSQFAAQGLNHG
jgi:hypothetical protein